VKMTVGLDATVNVFKVLVLSVVEME